MDLSLLRKPFAIVTVEKERTKETFSRKKKSCQNGKTSRLDGAPLTFPPMPK